VTNVVSKIINFNFFPYHTIPLSVFSTELSFRFFFVLFKSQHFCDLIWVRMALNSHFSFFNHFPWHISSLPTCCSSPRWYTHTHIHTHTLIHTHTHTLLHTHAHTCIHTHIYTHTYTHTHTRTHAHLEKDRNGVATISRLLQMIGLFGRI